MVQQLNSNNTAVIIGKSVIKRFFDYYDNENLDDEVLFFPILKTIINGVVDNLKNDHQKLKIKTELKEYTKQLYIAVWLQYVEEYEEEVDVEYERKAAIKQFEDFYRKV